MWRWPIFKRIPFRLRVMIRRKLPTFSTLVSPNLKIRFPQAMLWTRSHQLHSHATSWILLRSLVMDQRSLRPGRRSQSQSKIKTRRRAAQTTSLSKQKMRCRLSSKVTQANDSSLRLPSSRFAGVLARNVRSRARRTQATWVLRVVLRRSSASFSAL